MPSKSEIAALELHKAYMENTVFPDTLHNVLSIDSAYETQFKLLDLRETQGEQLVGWKVGLTSTAMQAQQGVHEPCLGHLLKSGHHVAPSEFEYELLYSPGFENELCLRLNKPLKGRDLSLDSVAGAIEAVAPALEIVEKRSKFGADFPLAIAGNAQQHAFVTGQFIPFSPGMDLALVGVEVKVNGELIDSAKGAEVLGTPLQSVSWLSGKLADFGRQLDAGTLIMTGSFTKQYGIEEGDRVQAAFDGLGVAEARFG